MLSNVQPYKSHPGSVPLLLYAHDHFHTERQAWAKILVSDPAQWANLWFFPFLYYVCLLLICWLADTLRSPLKVSASSKDLFSPDASTHHQTGSSLQSIPGWTLPLCLSYRYELREWISPRVSCSYDSREHAWPLHICRCVALESFYLMAISSSPYLMVVSQAWESPISATVHFSSFPLSVYSIPGLCKM